MKISSVIRTIAKKKMFFLALLFMVAVGFVFSAQGARAGWDTDWVSEILSSIAYPFVKFLAQVLSGVANITNWAMQPTSITTSSFVQAGWTATRDFANSLFILILLAIALSFILFDSFGVKKMLPKLLLIALLINFSVPIAGVALDFANIISAHFLASVSGTGFTEVLAQTVGIAKIFNMDDSGFHKIINPDAEKVLETSFINMLFSIGFLIGMIFIFLALALMFLIRTGYISVLLILLPLALVLSAFPPTSKHFGKWMSKFTQWVMFAPAATFFLYLSMLLLVKTGTEGIASMGGGSLPAGLAFTLLRYIMAWGLMLGSLVAAQSMGITTAGAALSTWKSGTKWARGKAGYYGKRGLEKAGVAKVMERGAQIAGKAPIIGGFAARGITTGAMRLRGAKEKKAELTKSELEIVEKGSPEAVTNLIQSYQKGTSVQKLKAAKLLALATEKGKFEPRDPATGDLSDTETLAARQSAYNTARTSGDIRTRRAIEASDHRIREQAVSHKFSNITTTRVNKHGVTEKYDQESGLFESEARDKIYNDIKPKDIAQLQDSSMPPAQLQSMVSEMMRTKAMTSRHLQEALDERKHAFLAEVKAYIKRTTPAPPAGTIGTQSQPATPTTSAMPATGLYAVHPGLASQLERSAGLAEVLLEVTP